MPKKREQVIQYIQKRPVGERVSVRRLARSLHVSEGTAYQAIKVAEERGIVSTIPRVGTVRVDMTQDRQQATLTYQMLLQVINGQVFGGQAGLEKVLHRFLIGAMTADRMLPYLTPDAVVIVGNREDIQRTALSHGAAVLVTGGLSVSDSMIALANQKQLPLLSTKFDTYTVATMIDRVLTNQQIRHKITTVADIFIPVTEVRTLYSRQTVADYKRLNRSSTHARFPVITETKQLVGIVTGKDVLDYSGQVRIDQVMTKSPASVNLTTSIASVSHMMIYEGYDLLPVVDQHLVLLGIISRQDVMAAMENNRDVSRIAGTYYGQVISRLQEWEGGKAYHVTVTPQMTNQIGTIAFGILTELVTNACQRHLQSQLHLAATIEQVDLHYLKLVQIESQLTIVPTVLDFGRQTAILDVAVQLNHQLVAKAIVNCQLLEKHR
jgi:predicted transcriptional regulator